MRETEDKAAMPHDEVQLNRFQEEIGYSFSDEDILRQSLIHRSYLGENSNISGSNERLEFIGDGFLDAIIGARLYELLPEHEEGTLSKLRALIVCEKALAAVGRELGIGEYLYLGRGESMAGGRNRESVLADAMEAVIGAVYMDGGYDAAREYVLRIMKHTIDDALAGRLFSDYKSMLQEKIQAVSARKLHYIVAGEKGPDHDKTFYVDLKFKGDIIGRGSGKSKKEAEQNAAKAAYEEGKKNNVF